MLSRENLLLEALSDLEAQRSRNLDTERARRETAVARSAEIGRLIQQRHQLFYSGMRGAFARPEEAKSISEQMRREIERINAALRRELVSAGLPEDYLQPVYRCPICRDTGYVGEPVHEQCVCLKRAVLTKLYENTGLQALEKENFQTFDERVFPDSPIEGRKSTQRGYIRKIRERCERFAETFETGRGSGLLLCGKSGLGKTFLMHCVAQRALERGFSVIVVSAYKLVETMRAYQFDGNGAETVSDYLNCDLLCIDDLGSEPMMRGVTVSWLYYIVNERHAAGRSVVVTTNCSVEQLYDKYDDRVAARLCDPGRMQIIEFIGEDVRRYASMVRAMSEA